MAMKMKAIIMLNYGVPLFSVNKLYLISLVLVISIFSSITKAETHLLSNYIVTDDCKSTLETGHSWTFKKFDHDPIDPAVVARLPNPEVSITRIQLGARGSISNAWLIESGEQGVVHCIKDLLASLSFALAERRKREMMFVDDEFDVIEVHLHHFVPCGTSCRRARVETIIFFDKDVSQPIYDHVEDTYPNEYPSKWFRAYLTEDERKVFDRVIAEG